MPSPVSRFERHIQVTAEQGSAVELLSAETGLSRTRIKQVMQQGAVWLSRSAYTQRLRRAAKPLQAGDELHLYYDEQVLSQSPPEATLIADEDDYSVWFKPAGMFSQGSKWGDHCAISRWSEQHLQPQRPAYLVHRLDRGASGLILLAHSKGMAKKLAALFQQRAVEKHYRVLVHGKFPSKPLPFVIDAELDGREARSRVRRLHFDVAAKTSLLDVAIETGRKHQIRRHLAGMGFPLCGDRLYGQDDEKGELQLSACLLAFTCPASGQVRRYSLPETLLPDVMRLAESIRPGAVKA